MKESTHVIQWSAINHINLSNAGLYQEKESFIFCRATKKTFKANCLIVNGVKKLSFNYCPLCGEKLEIAEGEKMEKNDQTKRTLSIISSKCVDPWYITKFPFLTVDGYNKLAKRDGREELTKEEYDLVKTELRRV